MLKFTVDGQKLELLGDPFVVADSFDFLTGSFKFYSGHDWELTEKHVFFQLGTGTPYEVTLTDDEFVKTDHVNLTTGIWSIYVIGYDIDGATLVERITTNKVSLTAQISGVPEGEPFPPSIIPDVLIVKDQTTPQTFINGIPKLAADRVISDDHHLTDKKYVDDHSTPIPDHNDLNGLQGGSSTERYHMTQAQNAALHAHGNKTALDAVSGTNTGDQVLPTRDSLGLDTDDNVTFANLSGTNTGDQDVDGAISTHNSDAEAHAELQIALRNSNIVITSTPISAPYNNLNTMPIGSIVGYALYVSSDTVANLPNGIHQGAVTTLAYTHSSPSIICQQMQSETKLAYRMCWAGNWSEWKILASTADIPVLPTTLIMGDRAITTAPTNPYNDLNTLPRGSIVTYSAYVSASLLHRPANFHQGTVLTIAYSNADSTSSVQMAFSAENVMSYRVKWSGVWSDWKDAPDAETVHTYDMTSLSIFSSVGVVGDSFASGATYGISGVANGEHYDVSWPAILGRMTGCTISNYSSGGLSTRTWLTDTSHGLQQLIADSPKNLYFLALGINDASLGAGYIGAVSDIHDDDYTLNADTFYGNYGRIVAQIILHSPAAKIVFIIPPQFASSGANAAWYAAMVEISGHYNMPCIASTNDVFFTTTFYTANLSTGHPIAITYAGMAQAYARLMALCIQENVSYFKDYVG